MSKERTQVLSKGMTKYQDKLHWLEMGIPFTDSQHNPNGMVFALAMYWEDVEPLIKHIKQLETERERLKCEVGLWLDGDQTALKALLVLAEILDMTEEVT